MYHLYTDNGSYSETSLVRLLFAVISHRLHHFVKGEGFRD